jgi:phosphoribosylformylglycinamidine synthase
MAFASHCGLDVELGDVADPIAAAFAEEPGAIVQIALADVDAALEILDSAGLRGAARCIAKPRVGPAISVRASGTLLQQATRTDLQRAWSETSYRMQTLRDDPKCAREAYENLLDTADPGLHATLSFDPGADVAAPYVARGARPPVAVLREQGVNSQVEMARALTDAGFDAHDVHMTDLLSGRTRLGGFRGLIACGGFSYGDVLGAGAGWAKSILLDMRLRDEFQAYFVKADSFTLGVCNGCQMLAVLKDIIPGASDWPRFVRNRSEQYEARLSLVRVPPSPSVLFAGMTDSILPIVVSHGEGRAEFSSSGAATNMLIDRLVALQFVDHYDRIAEHYPENPNGSPLGIAAVTTPDGRVTALMPHPERIYRTVQHSWHPKQWGEHGPWMRLFRNARVFVA